MRRRRVSNKYFCHRLFSVIRFSSVTRYSLCLSFQSPISIAVIPIMVTEQDSEGPSFGKEARAVADT